MSELVRRNQQMREYQMSKNRLYKVEYKPVAGSVALPADEWRLGVANLEKTDADSLAGLWTRLKFCSETRVLPVTPLASTPADDK